MSSNYCKQNISKRLFKSQEIVKVTSSYLDDTEITSKSDLINCVPLDSSSILIFLGILIIVILFGISIFRNTKDESRKLILNIQTFISTGSGTLSLGDILGTIANTINNIPNTAETNQNIQELKQLLNELKIEIQKENLLAAESQRNILNELQLLLDVKIQDANNIDSLKEKTPSTLIFLQGAISNFPADNNLVLECERLIPAIKQKLQQIR